MFFKLVKGLEREVLVKSAKYVEVTSNCPAAKLNKDDNENYSLEL